MKFIQQLIILLAILLGLSACSSTSTTTLYDELGGETKIREIAENLVLEFEMDEYILPYYEGSDINRFVEKLTEYICEVADGPCVYTGRSMVDVHTGMNITESHYNRLVDLSINAMDKAGIPHRTQNKLLARLAPTRKDMLYR